MDATSLKACIAATLQTEGDPRRKAELNLKAAEEQPGFVLALLDILQGGQATGEQLSAAIYLKNAITRRGFWSIQGAKLPCANGMSRTQAGTLRLKSTPQLERLTVDLFAAGSSQLLLRPPPMFARS